MTFSLRPHQAAMDRICLEILNGAKVSRIIAAVTPGGGKSKLPVILADRLIPTVADRLIWIVPRNSLKWQGEAEFHDQGMPTPRKLRATTGNEPDPCRGTDGYLTTYQAIGMSPDAHQAYCKKYRTILFLDEPHHVKEGANWAEVLAPMIESAALVVFASGTFSRGDGQAIHGLEYEDSYVDLQDRDHTRVIRYGRRQAIIDKAILPVHGKTIDGAAEWISAEGIHRRIESLAKAGEDRTAALFSMLRTGYAYQLLDGCMADWELTRDQYPEAKLLVVATNIETAKEYHAHVARRHLSEIATSDDSARARQVIQEYRRGSIKVLVTVGMAYEGLSVPEITHIACLTHIRSVPWLEQCFARANRRAPGKVCGVIWGPADQSFIQSMRMIEREQSIPLGDQAERKEKSENQVELVEGVSAPEIEPLWSSAHGIQVELAPVQQSIPTSEAERILRDNIRAIKRDVLAKTRPGSLGAKERILNMKIRRVVDKSLDDMSVEELERVWEMMRG